MATANNQHFGRPHGYPTQIIQGPVGHTFLCSSCKWILKHPIQSLCGHRFCKECIDYLIEIGGSNGMCPSCQEEDNENEYSKLDVNQILPDRATKREIRSLHVRCANDSCSWEGTFKDYEATHLPSCPAYPVSCPDCGQRNIPRNQMEAHGDLNTGDCTKPVPCPFGCEELVDRTKMTEHKKEKNYLHLDKLRERVETLECGGNGQRTLPGGSGDDQLETLNRKIEMLERQLSERPQIQDSEAAVSNSSVLSATPGSGDPQLSMVEFKVEAFENMVAVLNTQMESSQKQIAELGQDRRIDRESVSTYETKTRNLERDMALTDVALAEQDLRMQSLEITGYEGIQLWKITDFSRRRQEAMNGRTTSIYSRAFYTNRTGYKMCASLYLNGDGMGKGTHISLFLVIMRGKDDARLRWPFKQKVTFMLLDQNNREHIIDAFRPDPSSSSFKRPVSEMNIASGFSYFVRHSVLENSRHAYIKDDTIFIKIIVDTSDLP